MNNVSDHTPEIRSPLDPHLKIETPLQCGSSKFVMSKILKRSYLLRERKLAGLHVIFGSDQD